MACLATMAEEQVLRPNIYLRSLRSDMNGIYWKAKKTDIQ